MGARFGDNEFILGDIQVKEYITTLRLGVVIGIHRIGIGLISQKTRESSLIWDHVNECLTILRGLIIDIIDERKKIIPLLQIFCSLIKGIHILSASRSQGKEVLREIVRGKDTLSHDSQCLFQIREILTSRVNLCIHLYQVSIILECSIEVIIIESIIEEVSGISSSTHRLRFIQINLQSGIQLRYTGYSSSIHICIDNSINIRVYLISQ